MGLSGILVEETGLDFSTLFPFYKQLDYRRIILFAVVRFFLNYKNACIN